MSSATVLVAANLLKALAILIKTTVRRSVVDQEHIKPCWKTEKGNISLCDQQSYYLQVFQTLLTTERRLTGRWFLAVDLSQTF